MKVSFGFLGTGLTRRVPHFWPQLVRPVLSRVINPIQSPSFTPFHFILGFYSQFFRCEEITCVWINQIQRFSGGFIFNFIIFLNLLLYVAAYGNLGV